ncbi:MAG: DUF1786 domain-containing protein [Desulfitobacteriaceae bacterium]
MTNSILAVDVGSGTQDVLFYQPGKNLENCPKFVVPSRTQIVAAQIRKATEQGRGFFLHGHIMGGGACGLALKKHIAAGLPAYVTREAALTFNDNLSRVAQMGVRFCQEAPSGTEPIWLGDIDLFSLEQALSAFGLEKPDKLAVAVQDHGFSETESNRTVRFKLWEQFVLSGGQLQSLVFQQEIPEVYTRMRSVRDILPTAVVTDTGTAALLGIMADPLVRPHLDKGILAINIGNSHTLAATIQGERVYGIFEQHTSMLGTSGLATLVDRFQRAELTNSEIYDNGGHGATLHPEMHTGWEFVVVTGPRRSMVKALNWYEAAPYGDMMLTGCFGLLAGLGIL